MDIDTRKSTCVVGYEKPRALDFDKVDSAAKDANYVLIGIGLRARGEVVRGHCATCDSEVSYLRFPGVQAMLELSGPVDLGTATLSGSVLDWGGDHPRLEVE